MAAPERDRFVSVLLDRYGTTYAAEAGIDVRRNTPSPLFRLLVLSLLLSARIRASVAVAAAKALYAAGWTTPRAMAAAGWEPRVRVLNRSGYARYDEKTSRMLGQTCEILLERWHGDLRELRREARCDPERERALVKVFPGIGDVGVDVFFREVQVSWSELFPFADRRALAVAEQLGLGSDARTLATGLEPETYARLVAALVRVALARAIDDVRAAAAAP